MDKNLHNILLEVCNLYDTCVSEHKNGFYTNYEKHRKKYNNNIKILGSKGRVDGLISIPPVLNRDKGVGSKVSAREKEKFIEVTENSKLLGEKIKSLANRGNRDDSSDVEIKSPPTDKSIIENNEIISKENYHLNSKNETLTVINTSRSWLVFSLKIGLVSTIVVFILILLPQDYLYIKIAALFGAATATFVYTRNPRTRYIRAFWVVFVVFTGAHGVPALGIDMGGPQWWAKVISKGPGTMFSIVMGIILALLLIFDRLEQNKR